LGVVHVSLRTPFRVSSRSGYTKRVPDAEMPKVCRKVCHIVQTDQMQRGLTPTLCTVERSL